MTESLELRVVEDFADRLFQPDEGKKLASGIVRLVTVDTNDPRLREIGQLQQSLRENDRSFFHGWEIIRKYSKRELQAACLLHLKIPSVFEPAGEECGTRYDESTACPICGADARQIGPLFLNLNRIPKGKDVAKTIAGEVVVSRRVAETFDRHGITGADVSPIRISQASSAESKDWFQLCVRNTGVDIISPTRVGIDPFDNDIDEQYLCSRGDTIGLSLLSELWVKSDSSIKTDFLSSRQFIGVRRGLLRPERVILVSQKVRQLAEAEKLKGFSFEVAQLTVES